MVFRLRQYPVRPMARRPEFHRSPSESGRSRAEGKLQLRADIVEKGGCCDAGISAIQPVSLAGLKIMMGHRQSRTGWVVV